MITTDPGLKNSFLADKHSLMMKACSFLLAFLMTGVSCRAQLTWCKAVYEQSYLYEGPTADGGTEVPVRHIEYHVNERYSYLPAVRFVKTEDAARLKQYNQLNLELAQAFPHVPVLIDYLERQCRSRSVTGSNCNPLMENISGIVPTGKTRKINNYECTSYSGKDASGKDVELWATRQLPWYINNGLYLPSLKEGIVEITMTLQNRPAVYRLIALEQRNDTIDIPEIRCN